ncbi:BgTH12-03150 [Blumeria graminis f. sp. triticale]|uniref:Bgt-50262 n=2 Tax=Blumeria graminis TaxID=34373 RepID=A0A9X9MJ69_BLUGR|nr:BgTH12-03150 [Blumeria graminis f. sp. triticale]VDB89584.1 Bgt-50262 [Blumeria graminis f. sp. tritici]
MSEGKDVGKYANELSQKQSQVASLDPSKRPSDITKKNRLLRHFESECNGYYGGVVAFLRLNTSISFSQRVNTLRETQSSLNRQKEAATVAHIRQRARNNAPRSIKYCAY